MSQKPVEIEKEIIQSPAPIEPLQQPGLSLNESLIIEKFDRSESFKFKTTKEISKQEADTLISKWIKKTRPENMEPFAYENINDGVQVSDKDPVVLDNGAIYMG